MYGTYFCYIMTIDEAYWIVFTWMFQDFLESEGIVVNDPEGIPTDPYINRRAEAAALRTYNTPSAFDKLKQFKELDRKVLRFFCVWDDRDSMFGEIRPFVVHVSLRLKILYMLVDFYAVSFFFFFITNMVQILFYLFFKNPQKSKKCLKINGLHLFTSVYHTYN